MEGKRFGIGLAAGILLALAIVTASGGLASTPLASFSNQILRSAPSASSTTVTTSTITMATTTVPPTVTFTSTLSITSTTSGVSEGSLNSSVTYPSYSVSTSSTTVTSTISSVPITTYNPNTGGQSALTSATSASNGTPYNFFMPSETNKPSQLANIAQLPIASKAEILAPVLVAFLLGAFLYRVATQERERSSED